jgi:hypothetical protein
MDEIPVGYQGPIAILNYMTLEGANEMLKEGYASPPKPKKGWMR